MGGEVKRKVQFTMPPGSIPVLRQREGYEDFSPVAEVLLLLRCGFGLKDAPRLAGHAEEGVGEDRRQGTHQRPAALCVPQREGRAADDHVLAR
eukprot:8010528-Pyramimonas_sp.AAC.1